MSRSDRDSRVGANRQQTDASERKGEAMGTTDDGSGRTRTATSGQAAGAPGVNGTGDTAVGGAGSSKARINHMPGAGTERAAAISAGRHEMLTDTRRLQIKSLAERGLKRPRIGIGRNTRIDCAIVDKNAAMKLRQRNEK